MVVQIGEYATFYPQCDRPVSYYALNPLLQSLPDGIVFSPYSVSILHVSLRAACWLVGCVMLVLERPRIRVN